MIRLWTMLKQDLEVHQASRPSPSRTGTRRPAGSAGLTCLAAGSLGYPGCPALPAACWGPYKVGATRGAVKLCRSITCRVSKKGLRKSFTNRRRGPIIHLSRGSG